MANHGVIRTDRMFGTDNRSGLISVQYFNGSDYADIDNGNVVDVSGGLLDGEREIFKGVKPATTTKVNNLVVLAAPEVMYDERLRNLEDYYNEAGKTIRAYRLHSWDIFSLTKDALDGKATPEIGDAVGVQAGTKLSVGGGTRIGEIVDINETVSRTYYAIKID